MVYLTGDVEVARILVEHGADVTMRNNKYRTVLHESAYRGHVNIVKMFIDVGVDVNAEDKDYR